MYNSKILEKENKRYDKVNGLANSSYTWHLNHVPKKILIGPQAEKLFLHERPYEDQKSRYRLEDTIYKLHILQKNSIWNMERILKFKSKKIF